MIKLAGMEETDVRDPKTGLPIFVSTTVRKVYRKIFRNSEEASLRNVPLNHLIAEDFAQSSGKVVCHTLR